MQRRLSRRGGDARPGTSLVLPWVLLVVFVGVVSYYVWPRPKSFFLDLTTDHLSVVTDADTQIVWELSQVAICLPRHRIDAAAFAGFAVPAVGRCNSDAYLELTQRDIELDWPEGIRLVMRPGPGRSLDVVVRFDAQPGPVRIGEIEIVSETILNLPEQVFAGFGGLGVTGQLVAGQLAENGTLMMLRDGKYETRERYWFRKSARMVDSGTFSLGDVVAIESGNRAKPLSSYAFVTLTEAAAVSGQARSSLRAIVTSQEAYSKLRLDRARAKSTVLEPSWAQRLSSDPLVIGFATVLSLFGATLAVLNAFMRKRD